MENKIINKDYSKIEHNFVIHIVAKIDKDGEIEINFDTNKQNNIDTIQKTIKILNKLNKIKKAELKNITDYLEVHNSINHQLTTL